MFSFTKSNKLLFLIIAHYSVSKERCLPSSGIKIALNFSGESVEVMAFTLYPQHKVQLSVITYWPPFLIFIQVVWLQGNLSHILLQVFLCTDLARKSNDN